MAGQPTATDAYTSSDNPISQDPTERSQESSYSTNEQVGKPISRDRVPEENAAATSRGSGVSDSGPADATEAEATSYQQKGKPLENDSVNAEQLATLSEDKVADAVDRKSGTQQAPGDNPVNVGDFASDLDRKKAEQAEAREAIKAERSAGGNVDGGMDSRIGNESIGDAQ